MMKISFSFKQESGYSGEFIEFTYEDDTEKVKVEGAETFPVSAKAYAISQLLQKLLYVVRQHTYSDQVTDEFGRIR